MADAVVVRTVSKGQRKIVLQLTCISDGTGEAAVIKQAVSGLTKAKGDTVTNLRIDEIKWDVQGFTSVRLLWDHTTDDVAMIMSGKGSASFEHVGGLVDPRSTGGTGDLLLTSVGAVSGATYDIVVVLVAR
jgi:hypothetical protein